MFPYERLICCGCVDDPDLRSFIETAGREDACTFCDDADCVTANFSDLAEFIKSKLEYNYAYAGDELPHDPESESGYFGRTRDTYDLLFDTLGVDLPRDKLGTLRRALVSEIGDHVWCDLHWQRLNEDERLFYSWDRFCDIVKRQRRFFFQDIGASDGTDIDLRSPTEFLAEVCNLAQQLELLIELPAGFETYRARMREPNEFHTSSASLGPPPYELALQSNRMNPAGISMYYASDCEKTAIAETRAQFISVGRFETLRPIRILDLANLKPAPGFFSAAVREDRLTHQFLRSFVSIISEPVMRNNRVNVDYIPTQVFTEFLRDFDFKEGKIDGLSYRSATGVIGTNFVLFAGPEDVEGATPPRGYEPYHPMLRLTAVEQRVAKEVLGIFDSQS